MAKVSIIMSCYNSRREWLFQAVDSVLAQTYQDYELIIIDDGSSTPIKDILSPYSDKRIKVYRISNSGLGAALNYGILQSEGEYISRLDDDDMMTPDRLIKQVKYLDDNPQVSCVGTDFFWLMNERYAKHPSLPTRHEELVSRLVTLKFPMAHSSLLFRKTACEAIGGYRVKGPGQDLDLLLQLSTQGELTNLPYYLTYYRLSNSSYSFTKTAERLKAYTFALESIKDNTKFANYKDIILHTLSQISQGSEKRNNPYVMKVRRFAMNMYMLLRGRTYK